jgi:hypothetical protein
MQEPAGDAELQIQCQLEFAKAAPRTKKGKIEVDKILRSFITVRFPTVWNHPQTFSLSASFWFPSSRVFALFIYHSDTNDIQRKP